MSNVIIAGGGAAGMIAAIYSARKGNKVTIYEKNKKLGKKLYITGKGRCNITNACDMEELFDNVVTNSRFLYSSFYGFNNYDIIDLFESLGLKTKIERGNRVFPQSDKSSDVIFSLAKELKRQGVKIEYNSEISDIIIENKVFKGITLKNSSNVITGDKIIIATGGLSYKTTGSTGDGYRFAEKIGHKVTELYPSLVPFNIKEKEIKELQGLSLKNIRIGITSKNKEVYSDFGEMLFTHFGVSGPVILSASSFVIPYMKNKDLILHIDLKPALTKEQLNDRIIRDFEELKNKQFRNSLDKLLPKKLIPIVIERCCINPDKKVNSISREERLKIVNILKDFTLGIASLREYNEAVITKGGVAVNEINPSTMESKIVKNIFFAGEVLDLDALTGGFNLQIAWSTGYAAGNAV